VRLSHHNLPRVVAYFQDEGRSYLVMEYVPGESVEKRLERANAPLLEVQVIDWAVQVCDVLAYLHSQSPPIIFRDLKPSNIMVTPEGTVKLIDFGIARTYKAGQRKDTVTMGSENYAAPEQWGEAQTDGRADVYGLGATLYHLLANVPPLPAFVPAERVSLRQYNTSVSDGTLAVVERAMAMKRDERFGSAVEMRAALLECLPRRERRRAEERAAGKLVAVPTTASDCPSAGGAEQAGARGSAGPFAAYAEKDAAVPPVLPTGDGPVCPFCGLRNRAAAAYCRNCGASVGRPRVGVLRLVETAGLPVRARWEYPLSRNLVLVGRRGGARPAELDLGYYDPEGYVSRNHARFTSHGGRYHVIDLGSANGTYVNGERLAPHQARCLAPGDRIQLGQVVLAFEMA